LIAESILSTVSKPKRNKFDALLFRILFNVKKQKLNVKQMRKILLITAIIFSTLVYGQKFEGLAKTPPMGWNSCYKFGCDVSEKLIKEITDAMVSSGMKDAGYEYIVIDDCWQVGRDENGNIIPDPERFPSGMKAVADYVHSLGLSSGYIRMQEP